MISVITDVAWDRVLFALLAAALLFLLGYYEYKIAEPSRREEWLKEMHCQMHRKQVKESLSDVQGCSFGNDQKPISTTATSDPTSISSVAPDSKKNPPQQGKASEHCPEFCQECTEKLETSHAPQGSRFKSICCIDHGDVSQKVPKAMLWHVCSDHRKQTGELETSVYSTLTDFERFKLTLSDEWREEGHKARTHVKRHLQNWRPDWIHALLVGCQMERIYAETTNPWNAFESTFLTQVGRREVHDVAMAYYTFKLHLTHHVPTFAIHTGQRTVRTIWDYLPSTNLSRHSALAPVDYNLYKQSSKQACAPTSGLRSAPVPKHSFAQPCVPMESSSATSEMRSQPVEPEAPPPATTYWTHVHHSEPCTGYSGNPQLRAELAHEEHSARQGSQVQNDSEVDEALGAWNAVKHPSVTIAAKCRYYAAAILVALLGIAAFYPSQESASAQPNLQ